MENRQVSEQSEIWIHWIDEDGYENSTLVLAARVSEEEFRIHAGGDIFGQAFHYGDRVQLRPRRDPGHYDFVRRSLPGGFRVNDYLLSKEVIESQELEQFLDRLSDQGVHWEQIFDGLLLVFLPADALYDPSPDLEEVFEQVHRFGPTPLKEDDKGFEVSPASRSFHLEMSTKPVSKALRGKKTGSTPDTGKPRGWLKDRILRFVFARRRG